MSHTTLPRQTKRERREQLRAERLATELAAVEHATRRRRLAFLAATAAAVAVAIALLAVVTGRNESRATGDGARASRR